jgi:predicted transcriptional regulator
MNELLNVISASDKRRNLLILLNSGPQEWDDIKRILNVTSTGMLPQIKILEEENLIQRDGRKIFLTPMGKILTTRMMPLVRTMDILDKNRKFWGEHDLGVLPEEILLDIGDLGNYEVIASSDVEIYESHEDFINNISQANTIRGISHMVHPNYPDLFLRFARAGKQTSLILTPAAFKIVNEKYHDPLAEWLTYDKSSLWVTNTNIRFSFIVTESFFSMALFFKNGVFDSKHDVNSHDISAIQWGERLFAYYQERSKKIDSLD